MKLTTLSDEDMKLMVGGKKGWFARFLQNAGRLAGMNPNI